MTELWEFITGAGESAIASVNGGNSVVGLRGLAVWSTYTVVVFVLGYLCGRVKRVTPLEASDLSSSETTVDADARADCDDLLAEITQEIDTHSESTRRLNEQLDSPDHDMIRDQARATRTENSQFLKFLNDRCSRLDRHEGNTGGEVATLVKSLSGHRRRASDLDEVLAQFEDRDQFESAISPLRECIEDLLSHNRQLQGELDRTRQAVAQQSQKLEQAEEEARIDALTGLPNRRAFDEQAQRSHSRFVENETRCVVALLDIDHFKSFNDQHGHAIGDKVLTIVADVLRRTQRETDHVARFGGEEFAILIPRMSGHQAKFVIDRQREQIEKAALALGGRNLSITVSAGVSELRPGDTIRTVLGRADKALYAAKDAGRNQTCLEDGGKLVYFNENWSPETAPVA